MGHNTTTTITKFERVEKELLNDLDRIPEDAKEDLRWSLIFLSNCIRTLKSIRIKIVP